MIKHYSIYLLFFFLASCSTHVSYLGNTFEPTKHVDVFVDESAVKNRYDIVGKGYIQRNYFSSVESIQVKAVEKAKKNGADAILIKDYYVPNTGAAINSTTHTDSLGKGVITVGQTTVQQTGTTGFTVLFLKYR
jgi:hypothetical protein